MIEEMLNDLQSNYLEVVLIPAPDPNHSVHYVRAVQSANADWYRKFCREYLSSRRDQNAKGRTLIKRRESEKALMKILRGETSGLYIQRLLAFVEREKANSNYQQQIVESVETLWF